MAFLSECPYTQLQLAAISHDCDNCPCGVLAGSALSWGLVTCGDAGAVGLALGFGAVWHGTAKCSVQQDTADQDALPPGPYLAVHGHPRPDPCYPGEQRFPRPQPAVERVEGSAMGGVHWCLYGIRYVWSVRVISARTPPRTCVHVSPGACDQLQPRSLAGPWSLSHMCLMLEQHEACSSGLPCGYAFVVCH